MTNTDELNQFLKNRSNKKNEDFKVRIDGLDERVSTLNITHNGNSWSGINIENAKEEIPLIIKELEFLLKYKK